ncbi:ABC transporter permease [Oceanicella actignis]|uniref:ABC transporter permease n=1 Tax=Oceanicella actignis TaxID=1189325 RepID=UPI0011E84B33|nr:ABC transporter permease [Oceanicella actignis]TYO91237.1 putative ABC transport system permease protein [Oceanicella actignis]
MSAPALAPLLAALGALASHWRRRPGQLAALLGGLAAATALWSGIQALNAHARASYDAAARELGGGARLVAAAPGATIDEGVFAALRRAGWSVSPVVEGAVRANGATLRVIGIDPVSAPAGLAPGVFGGGSGDDGGDAGDGGDGGAPGGGHGSRAPGEGDAARDLAAFITPPGLALAAPETLAALGLSPGARPRAQGGRPLPPVRPAAGAPPGALVMDVGMAQAALGLEGRLSALALAGPVPPAAADLPARLGLSMREAPAGADLARLTASFHMNLDAFALLAFLVGLFIARAAAGLAFEQRRPLLRTMRACGLAASTAAWALAIEALGAALVAGLAGLAGGRALARALLPDLAESLNALYGAQLGAELAPGPAWWAGGLAMSCAGALAAALGGVWSAARMPALDSARPTAWRRAQRRRTRLQLAGAAGAGLAGAAAFGALGGLAGGFALLAGAMLSAALALPAALDLALALAERAARRLGALAHWAAADARQQLPGLALALMALLLALGANIGVGAMTEGFRRTFEDWLEQRLTAELYVRAGDPAEADALAAWLAARPEAAAVLRESEARLRIGGWPVALRGAPDHPTYRERWPLLSAEPGARDAIAAGRGAAASEQLARRLGLGLGDELSVPTPRGPWRLRIVALFADYGAAEGKLRVNDAAMAAHFPAADRTRMAVRADPAAVPALAAAVAAHGPGAPQVIDRAALKARSLRIFERTFAVTAALNALTFAVAGAALFAALATLARARLAQSAPVWAMGAPRRALVRLDLAKTVALALGTSALAVPLGVATTWILVAVVNVEAFGWRLPMHVFPGQWLRLAALAGLTAAAASLAASRALSRTPPATLAKVFADER